MIITISGLPGSGKSTVARIVASELNLAHHSGGEFMRKEAEDRDISLIELGKLAEEDRSIDEELDQWQMHLGRTEDYFVIDSRLGFHFIPNSIKIFLKADKEIIAKRVFAEDVRQENNISEKSTLEKLNQREESEKKRYKEYYDLDYTNESNYELVIDTTNISAQEAADKIIEFVKKNKLTKKKTLNNEQSSSLKFPKT